MNNWIKCSERLPNISKFEQKYPCIFCDMEFTTYGYFTHDYRPKFVSTKDGCEIEMDIVTHWMPLPEPPKEE